jgi:hypothetical protein
LRRAKSPRPRSACLRRSGRRAGAPRAAEGSRRPWRQHSPCRFTEPFRRQARLGPAPSWVYPDRWALAAALVALAAVALGGLVRGSTRAYLAATALALAAGAEAFAAAADARHWLLGPLDNDGPLAFINLYDGAAPPVPTPLAWGAGAVVWTLAAFILARRARRLPGLGRPRVGGLRSALSGSDLASVVAAAASVGAAGYWYGYELRAFVSHSLRSAVASSFQDRLPAPWPPPASIAAVAAIVVAGIWLVASRVRDGVSAALGALSIALATAGIAYWLSAATNDRLNWPFTHLDDAALTGNGPDTGPTPSAAALFVLCCVLALYAACRLPTWRSRRRGTVAPTVAPTPTLGRRPPG